MNLHIFRVVFVIFVMRRVLWVFQNKIAEAGTVHLVVHFAGQEEGCVADRLGLELPPVHSPESAVLAVVFFIHCNRLG